MQAEDTSTKQTQNRQGARIEDLDTKVSRVNAEAGEDLAAFLISSWQQILGGIFVILIGFVLYEQYKTTSAAKIADSSNNYDISISGFNSQLANRPYLGKPTAEELKNLLQTEGAKNSLDVLAKLKSSEANTIYGKLAGLYQAQGFIRMARYDEALQTLKEYGSESFESQTKTDRDAVESLVSELSALMSARTLILKAEESSSVSARKRLGALVERAETVPLEALIVLARISKTKEQEQEVADFALKLIARFPTMSEQVSAQLEEQGIEISKAKA